MSKKLLYIVTTATLLIAAAVATTLPAGARQVPLVLCPGFRPWER